MSELPGKRVPISEIRLKNFKSVGEATLALRHLTVIVGQNSSGKSTLLQSLLALAQAVQASESSALFPLNGELVRLGAFEDVRSFGAAPDSVVSLGFTLQSPTANPAHGRVRRVRTPFSITWDAHLRRPPAGGSSFAVVDAMEFTMQLANRDAGSSAATLSVSAIHEDGDIDDIAAGPTLDSATRLSVDGRLTDFSSGQSQRVDRVEWTGGLPLDLYQRTARIELWCELWWNANQSVLQQIREQERERLLTDGAPGAASRQPTACVNAAIADFTSLASEAEQLRLGGVLSRGYEVGEYEEDEFADIARQRTARSSRSIARSMERLGEAGFRRVMRKRLKGEPWLEEVVETSVGGPLRQAFAMAARTASALFGNVRYLGPLREAPQVLYNPSMAGDLGIRGQYSAAVLHARRNSTVRVPLPDGRVDEMRLGQALNLWLAELGLASGANATDRGRVGMGLTVSPVGAGREVDLTAVGVGVSQALPVVLACLLAAPGSVIVLEQPELHLHPALQLRLADFLLACARSGRQLLIETHSEHLVNRLRYRVAADESRVTGDLVGLLFAEQQDGVTTYRESDVNALGGLADDWPSGFLDVASDEAARFLRQTLAKKRSISSGN